MHPYSPPLATTALRACLLPLAAAALSLPARAAEAPSRITQVTVYPGTALVERSARVASGARQLVLGCLAGNFDMASLVVDADAGIRVGPVSAVNLPRKQAPECNGTAQDARIQALEDQLAALNAEDGGQEMALGYLRALAPPAVQAPTGEARKAAAATPAAPPTAPHAAPPANQLLATVDAIKRSGQEALNQQHRIARQREAIERQLKPLQAERDRLLKMDGEVRTLSISVAASREGELRLRYQVRGPSWAPSYRATLDSAAGSVLVERLAQISQRSGEDWEGVSLRLSTGSPRAAAQGPQPRPWTLSVAAPERQRISVASAMAPPPAPAPVVQGEAARDEEPDFGIATVQGEFATEFQIAGKVDVQSSQQRVSFSLGQSRLPAKVVVQATPALDATAYVVAELARPAGVWPDGSLQLLRGSQVVGQSAWRMAGRETLLLPFGRDELVRVQVNPVEEKQGSAGFTGGKTERLIGRSYQVENRHEQAIALRVLEASPVSTDERIAVAHKFNPATSPGRWQDQPGVVAWERPLAAGQSASFTADYTIGHAKELPVQERQ